jgi:hypothetical protein
MNFFLFQDSFFANSTALLPALARSLALTPTQEHHRHRHHDDSLVGSNYRYRYYRYETIVGNEGVIVACHLRASSLTERIRMMSR